MGHNMRGAVATMILPALMMAGCHNAKSRLDSKEAVRQAVEAHLKGNAQLALSNFDTTIQSVKFQGDTADALVQFQAKDMPGAKVLVRYKLKKAGDHWEVTSSMPAGGQGVHGGMGTAATPAAPPAMPSSSPQHGQLAPESSH